MAFPNKAIPRQQMIGRHCDISLNDKGTNILKPAGYREWKVEFRSGTKIPPLLVESLAEFRELIKRNLPFSNHWCVFPALVAGPIVWVNFNSS